MFTRLWLIALLCSGILLATDAAAQVRLNIPEGCRLINGRIVCPKMQASPPRARPVPRASRENIRRGIVVVPKSGTNKSNSNAAIGGGSVGAAIGGGTAGSVGSLGSIVSPSPSRDAPAAEPVIIMPSSRPVARSATSPQFAEGEATRLFTGPTEYPPDQFGAYAIIAFKSGADASDLRRYRNICEAYFRAIPESVRDSDPTFQLLTVWPIASDGIARKLRGQTDAEAACEIAARNYGHVMGLRAIRDARKISPVLRDAMTSYRGPFLLAWNPANKKGQDDALILAMDLSNVETIFHAKRRFEFWVQQIETHPELWIDGWQRAPIKDRVAQSLDRYGEVILGFFGAGGD